MPTANVRFSTTATCHTRMINTLRISSMDVVVREGRDALFLVEPLHLHLDLSGVVSPDRADVALTVDQEFRVRPRGEHTVGGDDRGVAVGYHREQDRWRRAELPDRIRGGLHRYGDDHVPPLRFLEAVLEGRHAAFGTAVADEPEELARMTARG